MLKTVRSLLYVVITTSTISFTLAYNYVKLSQKVNLLEKEVKILEEEVYKLKKELEGNLEDESGKE